MGWNVDLVYCELSLSCCTMGWMGQYTIALTCTVCWNVGLVYCELGLRCCTADQRYDKNSDKNRLVEIKAKLEAN